VPERDVTIEKQYLDDWLRARARKRISDRGREGGDHQEIFGTRPLRQANQ
jgi:hypothetical protein